MKAVFAAAAIALAPLAAAQSDNSQVILTLINATISDIMNVNNTLNQFADDAQDIGFNAIGLLGASNQLAQDVNSTTGNASSSSQFGMSEKIFNELFNLVEPTFELLDNFVAHCQAFENTDLKGAVLTQLSAQRVAVLDETNQLVSKLEAPYASSASVGGKLFVRAFSSVLRVFNNPCNANCGAGGSGSGSGSGATPAAGGAGSAPTSTTSIGPFVPNTLDPNHFQGAAAKKRSPIASLLAML